eukprot:12932651-Prorocentrum_lima.AAC.1
MFLEVPSKSVEYMLDFGERQCALRIRPRSTIFGTARREWSYVALAFPAAQDGPALLILGLETSRRPSIPE